VNPVLERWNGRTENEAAEEILPCGGSRRWARALADLRPFADAASLLEQSDGIWNRVDLLDWDEAFATHPRIGDKKAPASATTKSAAWSSQEQSGVAGAADDIQERLRQRNEEYERRFGRTYIVCATGKSAEEMLAILEQRLQNDDAAERREAAEQQRQISRLRLRKWLEL